MSKVKRLRIFAGPNGSGKSTFIRCVMANPPSPNFKLGYYVNADDIEKSLKNKEVFNFSIYGLQITNSQLKSYFKKSTFAPVKLNLPDLYLKIHVQNNILVIDNSLKIDSYISADLSEFIRQKILKQNYSFSYETVMSDLKKIDFLKKAKRAGYKIYLYYFATEDPLININKVKIRVEQDGHPVTEENIKKRYYKSLKNLKPAIRLSDRAYLFDTSQKASVLIAEINQGKNVNLIDPKDVPNWFITYVAN